jgi:uncharacterized protein YoxC
MIEVAIAVLMYGIIVQLNNINTTLEEIRRTINCK